METRVTQNPVEIEPVFGLPPPPRFDAAARAAAQRVEPLPRISLIAWLYRTAKYSRLINIRAGVLALVGVGGLITGATGAILVVDKAPPQQFNSSSMSSAGMPGEAWNSTPLTTENNFLGGGDLNSLAESLEERPRSELRRQSRRESTASLNDNERDERDKDKDKDKDDDEDEDKSRDSQEDDEDRKKEREIKRKDRDRDRDEDSERKKRLRLNAH